MMGNFIPYWGAPEAIGDVVRNTGAFSKIGVGIGVGTAPVTIQGANGAIFANVLKTGGGAAIQAMIDGAGAGVMDLNDAAGAASTRLNGGGVSYFGGYLGLGTAAPATLLHAHLNSGQSAHFTADGNNRGGIKVGNNIMELAFEVQNPYWGQGLGTVSAHDLTLATTNIARITIGSNGHTKLHSRFGCNNATPRAAAAVNVASADLPTVIALCNQLRAGLIANGIAV